MITISMDPVAFYLGHIEIRWYGIIVAIAILTLTLWMWRQITVNKDRIPPIDPMIAVGAIASGFGMAKLFHVIDLWDYYSQNPAAVFSGAGISVLGGIVGASLFFWIYSRKKNYPFWFVADLAAPGILLAQAIGRAACPINGCSFGTPTSLPWGFIYTHPNSFAPLGVALHPTAVYEIIFAMSLFGILRKLRGRLKPDGSIFLLYLVAYSAWRIGDGFLRVGAPHLLGMTAAQIIAIVIFAITLPWFVLRMRRAKTEA